MLKKSSSWTVAAVALALAACAPAGNGGGDAGPGAEKAAAAAPVALAAPAGTYKLDPSHASLVWKVRHLGLADYTARFTKMDATITLDPQNIAASQIALTIDPNSVETDHPGDYKGTHNTGFSSFDEDLAKSDKFFNAGQFKEIAFRSTSITPTGERTADVTGDLTLLGVTKPVTLAVTFNGELTPHPFTKAAALGFSAQGSFNRSEFGMTHLAPDIVGDKVTVLFEGEFMEQAGAAQ